jgi:hypothetical protein
MIRTKKTYFPIYSFCFKITKIHSKIVSLSIEKSTAKTELEIGSENCITADSEIDSQTMSLSI